MIIRDFDFKRHVNWDVGILYIYIPILLGWTHTWQKMKNSGANQVFTWFHKQIKVVSKEILNNVHRLDSGGFVITSMQSLYNLLTASSSVWLVEHGGKITQWERKGFEPLTLFCSTWSLHFFQQIEL